MARPPAVETDTALWLALDIGSLGLTDEQLYRLFENNPGFRFEISADGELIVMSPTSLETERRNARIIQRLGNWAEKDGSGEFFGSSGMVTLPNGARRCPDAAWISKTRWDRRNHDERDSFSKVVPEFVIELRSCSDRLARLREKMEEYIANGVLLGWLLDPLENCVYVYRPDAPVERLVRPVLVDASPVLPGFRLDFREVL